jgi:MFS family permease
LTLAPAIDPGLRRDDEGGKSYRWYVLVVMMIAQAITIGGTYYVYGVLTAAINVEFKATQASTNAGISTMLVLMSVFGPMCGAVIDRKPAKPLLYLGAISFAVGFACLSLAQQMWHVTLIFSTLFVVGQFFFGPIIANVLVARWFRDRLGLAFGLSAAGYSIGGFILPPLMQSLISDIGWRPTTLIFAAGAATLALPMIWFLKVDLPSVAVLETATPASVVWPTARVLKNRDFWLIAVITGAMIFCHSGISINLVAYARHIGTTAFDAARLMSLFALFGVLGKISIGAAIDRYSAVFAARISIILTGIAMIILLSSQAYLALLAGAACLGFAMGGLTPVQYAMVAERFGVVGYGRIIGLLSLVTFWGQTSPVVAAAVFDKTGSYAPNFIATLVVLSVVALLSIWFSPTDSGHAMRSEEKA